MSNVYIGCYHCLPQIYCHGLTVIWKTGGTARGHVLMSGCRRRRNPDVIDSICCLSVRSLGRHPPLTKIGSVKTCRAGLPSVFGRRPWSTVCSWGSSADNDALGPDCAHRSTDTALADALTFPAGHGVMKTTDADLVVSRVSCQI